MSVCKWRLSFITNKNKYGVHFQGTPANFGRPISVSDYKAIVEAMKVHLLPEDIESLLGAKPKRKARKEPGGGEEKPVIKIGILIAGTFNGAVVSYLVSAIWNRYLKMLSFD
ncbi:MAG: hypothetical protein QXL67_05610 [Candidatus Bathyarchaeia archaeon]